MATLLWIPAVLALLLLLTLWLIRPSLPRRDITPLMCRHYAHRGLWNAERPENSLAAFRAAVDAGYGIELDVHLTKDGHLVVHHDFSLKRICGEDILIEQHDLSRLRRCRLGQTDEPVPTFDEVLALVAGRVPLIVELKVAGNADALSAAVCERMQRYRGPWCMESFHPTAPRWFRKNAPAVIRGQLTYNHMGREGRKLISRLTDAAIAAQVFNVIARPDFIAYEGMTEKRRSLPMNLIRRFMRPHLVAWTIRSQDELDQLQGRYDLFIFEKFEPKN